jgi:hypothetical protein
MQKIIARAERYRIGHEPVLALMRGARPQLAESSMKRPSVTVVATFLRDVA